jgi:hypothetical protein
MLNLTASYQHNGEQEIKTVFIDAKFYGSSNLSTKQVEDALRNMVGNPNFVKGLVSDLENSRWTVEKIPVSTLQPSFNINLVEVENGTKINVHMKMLLVTRESHPYYLQDVFSEWIKAWFGAHFKLSSNITVTSSVLNQHICVSV